MPIRWWRSPVLLYPLLLAFAWTALELWRLPEAWAQDPPPRPNKRTVTRGDEFTKSLKDVHRLTKAALDAQAPGGDLGAAMAGLESARQAVREADRKVRDQFAATEQKLRQANLPVEILQRHAEAVRSYDAKHKQLDTELAEAEAAHGRITDHWNFQDRAPDHARLRHHLSKASDLLDKHTPKPTHRPLDPHKLPSRPAEPRWQTPQTNSRILPTYARPGSPWLATQDTLDPAYVTQVAAGSDALVAQVLPKTSGLPTTPTAADLAPTEDVQITQEIRDLAAELNNDPVKIYEYVRNTIDIEPTWGSIKGSVLTLWERSGNAFDTASLLIALFRAANIPARYVLGTIQAPAAQAQNWVGGVTTPQIAATILASGGVPTSYSATHVTLEHIWVEAYVPFGHYRGVAMGPTGKTWIPLDASYKQYTYTQGLDVPAIVGFDVNAFLQQAQVRATIDPATGSATNINQAFIESETARLRQLLQAHIETALPNASAADITGGRSIAKVNLGLLPASLPYRALATTNDAVALPNNVRHHVTIVLLDEFGLTQVASVTRSLPQVATQKITISYGPAADADRSTLESLASQQATSIPAYLIRLNPEIRIDETVVAAGPSIGMGKNQAIVVTLEGPNQSSEQLRHDRIAGDYSLVGLALGNGAAGQLMDVRDRLFRMKARVEREQFAGLTKEHVLGDLLHAIGLLYWGTVSSVVRLAAGVKRVAAVRLPSEGLATLAMRVGYAFDSPLTADTGGLALDVKHDRLLRVSTSGDASLEAAFSMTASVAGSALEGLVLEQVLPQGNQAQAVSAARMLQIASNRGIAILSITNANLTTILPVLGLGEEVVADIQNATAAGKVVVVPATEIELDGWRGVGYLLLDPATGAGAFRISGGLEGGVLPLLWEVFGDLKDWKWALFCGIGVAISLFLPFTVLMVGVGLLLGAGLAVLSVLVDNGLSGRPVTTVPSNAAVITAIVNVLIQAILGIGISYFLSLPVLLITPVSVIAMVCAILILTAILFDRVMSQVSWRRGQHAYVWT